MARFIDVLWTLMLFNLALGVVYESGFFGGVRSAAYDATMSLNVNDVSQDNDNIDFSGYPIIDSVYGIIGWAGKFIKILLLGIAWAFFGPMFIMDEFGLPAQLIAFFTTPLALLLGKYVFGLITGKTTEDP